MIILSLLILFLSVGVTSAATDISDDSIVINGNGGDTLAVSENTGGADNIGASNECNDVLADESNGAFKDLNSIVQNTEENATVELTKNYAFTVDVDNDFTDGIIISTNGLTIDGKGNTLNGNGMARIFIVNADNVILKNINFINGNTQISGGAIVWNGTNGIVANSHFNNNTAIVNSSSRGLGGAIHWTGSNGVVYGSTFNNNSVSGSGGDSGGAILVDENSNLSIYDSNFTNNYASSIGGAISAWVGFANITDCRFIDNNCGWHGGAIYSWNYGTINVDDCIFINNTAKNGNGGAVLINVNGTITNSTFMGNKADQGGAVNMGTNSANNTVTNSMPSG